MKKKEQNLNEINKEISSLESELQSLDKVVEQSKNENFQTQKNLQNEAKKGQELENNLKILENKIRSVKILSKKNKFFFILFVHFLKINSSNYFYF